VSNLPLQLVHSDVWQSPVVSLSGCRYHVIFIDDYSRFSWLFPLKSKSDVYPCFIKFKCMVENLFSSKIKSFQSDGGGEYSYTPFKNLLTQHGIFHRFSCPHTSQQNGVAKRKHRHVVDTGLALLAHSGLSTKYWVDAFLTAIYLINRLPTPTISNQTPYFKLFHHDPDYNILRTFGCACFPLMRPYNPHKLAFRSKKCIFLGYSSNHRGYRCLDFSTNHRGYRCLDFSTNRVYISRDVVFNEQDFPAKTSPSLRVSTENPRLEESVLLPPPPHSGLSLPSSPPIISLTELDTTPPSPPSTTPTSLPPLPETTFSSIPSEPPQDPPPTHRMITRSMTGSTRPKSFRDHQLYYSTSHPLKAFDSSLVPSEPNTYNQASKQPEWLVAMEAEFGALTTNGTWSLCP
jgi:hypothetical protein